MLQTDVERLSDETPEACSEADFRLSQTSKDGRNAGALRAAEPDPAARSGWRVDRGESIPDCVQGAARL